jgi:WD40 repeat protein
MSILGPSSLSQRDVQFGAPRGARFGPPGTDDEIVARAGQVKHAVLAMRGKLTDAVAKNERLESEVLSKTQQVEQLNAMQTQLEEQREALEDEMRVTQRKLAKAERDLQGRDEVIRAGIERDSRNATEKRMLRDKLAQEKMLTQENLNRVRALETELETARGLLDVSEDMQVQLVDRIVEFEGEIEKLKHFEALATELNREKAVLETDMRYKQNEIDKLQNEVRPELQARLRAAEEALRTLQSENDDLRLRAQAAVSQQEQARMIAMQKESEAKQDRYMQQMKDWSQDMILENVVPDDAASRTQQAAVDKALRFVYSSRPILEKVMIPSDIGHDIFTEHVWKQLADRLGVANATRNDDEACIVDPVELECVNNPAYRMNSMAYNKNTLDGIRKTTKKDPMTRETVSDSAWQVLNNPDSVNHIKNHETHTLPTLEIEHVDSDSDIFIRQHLANLQSFDAAFNEFKITHHEALQTVKNTMSDYNINSIAFDGKTLATSYVNTAKLWDANTGELKHTCVGHNDVVTTLCISSDGSAIFTGSFDKTAKMWDAFTGALLNTFNGHTACVNSVACNTDGTTIVTGSEDGMAILWDVATGEQKMTIEIDGSWGNWVDFVSFNHDGTKFATCSGCKIQVWDAVSGVLKTYFSIVSNASVSYMAFSPDGRSMVTGSECKVSIWELSSGRETIIQDSFINKVTSVDWSKNGRTIAIGHENGSVDIWNVATETINDTLEIDFYNSIFVAFSPDGRALATVAQSGKVKVFDMDFKMNADGSVKNVKNLWIED